jgi:hypothetical protein
MMVIQIKYVRYRNNNRYLMMDLVYLIVLIISTILINDLRYSLIFYLLIFYMYV